MQPLLASDPTAVDDYRLLARLGSGAMGGVYLGRSRGGRIVAVKLIRADLAEDPEFRERFRREAEAARSVGGFWTAAVVSADPDAEQPWLATEYVPGPTLHAAVSDHGPLPEATVRSLGAGLAEALVAIHEAGLVHRDLKPANVLLGPDGPRVIDFGIARAMTGHSLTATGIFLGTPGFFSPEQTLGADVGPPSDVFSLGAVLAFAATATGPFGEESTAALLYRVAHGEPDLSEVPAGLRELLADCLAKDPAARPTPAQLLDRIGETKPQGSGWLPPSITAVITQHTTELQRTAQAPPPQPTPVGAPKPATLQVPPAQPPAPAPAPGRPAQPPRAQPPARPPMGEPIRPRQPQQTRSEPRVRRDGPGPEFRTAGRAGSVIWAFVFALLLLGAYAAARFLGPGAAGLLPAGGDTAVLAAQIGVALLVLGLVWSVLRALVPHLRLKINSEGVVVSRLGMTREIPWSQVSRVGVAGKGKSAALAVWFTDGSVPPSRPWHRVGRYHGGATVFPIGATGGIITRRQQARKVREALGQYAPGRYDSRML
ncbi:serine/threonine-protein kinase [Saccharopolyspora griseoalba]|uniref:Serine/threonine-protein kinase n=1 Tax=Saccharopolyspora griseoalba TaxID=1431848 RepID=A0ABW2LP59_9PSEU